MLDPTVMVIVEVPEPGAAMVLGLKLTVVPVGAPEAERLIELLKPPLTAVVMVEAPWFPCATVTEPGEAERVKLPDVATGVRKATICIIHAPDATGAVAL